MSKESLPPWLRQLWDELTTPPAILRQPPDIGRPSGRFAQKRQEESSDEPSESPTDPKDARKNNARPLQNTERFTRQYFSAKRTQRPPSKPRPKLPPAPKRKKKRVYSTADVVPAARNAVSMELPKRSDTTKKRRPTSAALSDWQVRITAVEPVSGIWRLQTSAGKTYALKEAHIPVERLRWMTDVCRELRKNQFHLVPEILRTKSGNPYLFDGESLYYAYEWLPGTPLRYDSLPQLGAAARTLARFHMESRDLPAFRTKVSPFPLVADLAHKQQELANIAKELDAKAAPDEFDQLFKSQLKSAIEQGESALALLKHPEVDAAVLAGQNGLCHLDVTAQNLIVNPDGSVQLIDLEMMNYAPRVVDLAHLLRRAMQSREAWSSEIAIVPIVAYNRTEPLSQGEYLLLEALLTFPYRIHRFYKNHYAAAPPSGEDAQAQIQQLKKALVLESDRITFLHSFSRQVTRRR